MLILLTIYYIIQLLLFIIIIYTSIIYFIDNYNNDLYYIHGRHFEFGSNSISLNTTFTRYDFKFKSTYDYAPVVIITLCNYNTSNISYSLIAVSKTGFSIGAQTNAPFIGPINYIDI